MNHQSIFELIGKRYLDTQHSAKYLQEIELELTKRKVIGPLRWVYEYIAASAFWWNVFWWDEFSLNGKDIIIGWTYNLVAFGLISVLVGAMVGKLFGIGIFIALHAVTVSIGFKIRAGTEGK